MPPKMSDERRKQVMKMASDILEALDEPEIAVGQRIGLSQQLLNKAKNYGEASDKTFRMLDEHWRKLGLGPPKAFVQAAAFAQECGVDLAIINDMASWKWGENPDPHAIFNALVAERDRRKAMKAG